MSTQQTARTRDWYTELDIRPVINASATLTALGGSIMPAPVREAMTSAATQFVDLRELQAKVGARIAELTRNEAAYVSSGAAGGVTLSVAACMTGDDPSLVTAFPDHARFARQELIIHRSQRNGYDYAAAMTGVRMIEIGGSIEELAAAINERTAAVLWFAGTRLKGDAPPLPDIIETAHAADIPVIVDAAAQIPTKDNLWYFTRELGADLSIFSGGKGLRGPQASGLVLGRRDLIAAVAANGSPNTAIGRPLKVGKEELIACLAAVEMYLDLDEDALLSDYERIVSFWIEGLSDITGVRTRRGYPSEAGQPHGRAIVQMLPEAPLDRDALHDALWDRNPRIAVMKEGDDTIALNPHCIEAGEETLVLEAIREVLV